MNKILDGLQDAADGNFNRVTINGQKWTRTDWQPIETAPRDPYVEILVAVPMYDEPGLLLRSAMWDPENEDWTVFMLHGSAEPIYWMPAPEMPTTV